MVSSDCVNVCDETKPTGATPFDTWCLLVSNPNPVYSVYFNVSIELSAPTTITATLTATPTTTTSSSSSSSTTVPRRKLESIFPKSNYPSASRRSEWSSIVVYFGLALLIGGFNIM